MEGEKYTCTHYDYLVSYLDNQNYLKLMRDIQTGVKESVTKEDQIYFITELRRMRKYHRDLFSKIFSNILKDFEVSMLFNDDSEVVYHALILVSEIFSFYEESYVNEWIKDLLKSVIEISAGNENFQIKKQTCIVLHNLAYNMFYEETLLTLFTLIKEEENISAIATDTLLSFITFIDEVNLVINFDWDNSLEILMELINSNLLSYMRRAKKIINYLYKKIHRERFFSFIAQYLGEGDQKIIYDLSNRDLEGEERVNSRDNDENRYNCLTTNS